MSSNWLKLEQDVNNLFSPQSHWQEVSNRRYYQRDLMDNTDPAFFCYVPQAYYRGYFHERTRRLANDLLFEPSLNEMRKMDCLLHAPKVATNSLFDEALNPRILIECKHQDSSGSTDWKLPSLVGEFHDPSYSWTTHQIVVLSGSWWHEKWETYLHGMTDWIKEMCPTVHFLWLDEFRDWLCEAFPTAPARSLKTRIRI